MMLQSVFGFLWRLVVCVLAFVFGMLLGGVLAGVTGLQPPTLPPEIDSTAAMMTFFVTSPLLVLALYVVGRNLAGGWLVRAAILALLAWIGFVVNNVVEATIFTSYATAPWFTIASFTPAVLLCAGATAWLFPGRGSDRSIIRIVKGYFQQRRASEWAGRFLLAAVVFMPIYYLFGMMVAPFVGDFYQQGEFGLAAPALSTLLPVLLGRSVFFFVACLPVVIAWRGRRVDLWLSLGFALFVLVGLLYMLAGSWIAPSVRLIHSLEILADSFVYAGAIVWLLAGATRSSSTPPQREKFGAAAGQA
ncbi:MAG: hypothetical protein DCC55_24425 [Chloroflexi bacterium]|nr:MAG: hypothetical protein DCC55_24425 [Chloroflexota bacterium]